MFGTDDVGGDCVGVTLAVAELALVAGLNARVLVVDLNYILESWNRINLNRASYFLIWDGVF